MNPRRHHAILILTLVLLGSWITGLDAHQDPCHRLHACPSDQGTYVCGDLGHCEQCRDNLYCLGGKLRAAAQESPLPAQPPSAKVEEASCATVEVCFTPGEDCTDRIVKILGEAKSSILVQAYSFTSAPIAKALVDAKKRGVRVEAILDKSNRTDKYSAADFLANSGIPTRIDAQHAIAHNKVIVIDAQTVIGGSFNYTKAAQNKNAANVEITRDKVVAAKYTANWQAHAQHSEPYVGRGVVR
jgi:phosphatidylserine/phosphatidylglycerophosphate/cardiolipin synthase-like enzyme